MSPLITANLQDVSADGPPQLEPGLYTLRSNKVEFQPAEGEKAPRIEVTFKDANADEGDTRTVRKIFSLKQKALCYLKQFLLSAGEAELAESAEFDTEALLNLEPKAVVNSRSWTDEVSGEVRSGANIQRFILPEAETKTASA